MARQKGLGRGLSALIPTQPAEEVKALSSDNEENTSGRPADIFFTPSRGATAVGGSARDLLMPRKDVSRETKTKGRRLGRKNPTTHDQNVSRETSTEDLVSVPGVYVVDIPLEKIVPNSKQPRTVFEEDELLELSKSITEVGLLQPIVVRPLGDDKFELIMGERRLRATTLAGMKTIQAIVRQTDDEDLLRDALLENLHRVQLNPLEEAAAYQQLMTEFGCTQTQLAERIARSRPQITNTMRLLRLPTGVQLQVAAGVISAGHARAILGLSSAEDQEYLCNRIIAEGLSVRSTEELVALGNIHAQPSSSRSSSRRSRSQITDYPELAHELEDLVESRVVIRQGKKSGKLEIQFADEADLRRIINSLMQK